MIRPRVVVNLRLESFKNFGSTDVARRMSVELHFNQQQTRVEPDKSLFDYAESLDIKVPTSCRKQGKCKECLVEVTAGMECLSSKVPEESHLKENFRLSCS